MCSAWRVLQGIRSPHGQAAANDCPPHHSICHTLGTVQPWLPPGCKAEGYISCLLFCAQALSLSAGDTVKLVDKTHKQHLAGGQTQCQKRSCVVGNLTLLLGCRPRCGCVCVLIAGISEPPPSVAPGRPQTGWPHTGSRVVRTGESSTWRLVVLVSPSLARVVSSRCRGLYAPCYFTWLLSPSSS